MKNFLEKDIKLAELCLRGKDTWSEQDLQFIKNVIKIKKEDTLKRGY